MSLPLRQLWAMAVGSTTGVTVAEEPGGRIGELEQTSVRDAAVAGSNGRPVTEPGCRHVEQHHQVHGGGGGSVGRGKGLGGLDVEGGAADGQRAVAADHAEAVVPGKVLQHDDGRWSGKANGTQLIVR